MYYLIIMEPENNDGNIEYKRHLVDKSDDRIEKLATQMKYRVIEGNGEALYYIGVEDDGKLSGITKEEYQETFKNLEKIAEKNEYKLTLLSSKSVSKDKSIYEFLIREINTSNYIDIKICVAGNVDSGKSTLLGVLTNGKLDDGRGSTRLSIFNHKHEITSGRTSSIAHHIMGFDINGKSINYKSSINNVSWPEIVKKSKKIISFYDLAGHEKYLKTTIRGLTSISPDYCFILVGANMGVSKMTREHIFICMTLNIPFSIVVTKTDICKERQNVLDITMSQIKKILKLPVLRRVQYSVTNTDEAITAAKNFRNESIVPVFKVSNVSGENLDILKTFLNLLQQRVPRMLDTTDVLMSIDGIFQVTGVGTVVAGDLIRGKVYVNDKIFLGPDRSGKYIQTQIRSIHVKRVPVLSAECGTYICLALKKVSRKSIRIGQVIVSNKDHCKSQKEFTADINIIRSNATTIKLGYEPTVHTSNIRQSAKIISIKHQDKDESDILRTGDRATVKFKFSNRPEYLQIGNQLIFSEGKIKAVGKIIE